VTAAAASEQTSTNTKNALRYLMIAPSEVRKSEPGV
jgi:hypothetical protein